MFFNVQRKFIFLFLLVIGFTSKAQISLSKKDSVVECEVIRPKGNIAKILKKSNKSLKGLPSFYKKEKKKDVIFQSNDIRVFRLAAAISEYYWTLEENQGGFGQKEEKVREYWDKLEKYLNFVYKRDCGIEFRIIKDTNLIFKKNPEYMHTDGVGNGSVNKAIKEKIGEENYDIGIVLMKSTRNLAGQAVLGGAASQFNKGEAFAWKKFATIAHELGHLLGADHVHQKDDARINEQGNGFSIMSYGDPRTFFSMFSINQIRSFVKIMPSYADSLHKTKIEEGYTENENGPWAKTYTEEKPQLDRDRIQYEYTVTKGTRYQFYIPVKNKNKEGILYNAHSYDVSLPGTTVNLNQRLYEPSKVPYVMFHPRYLKPVKRRDNRYGYESYNAVVADYSQQYDKGSYLYCLSAFKDGHHDAILTKLNIVDGEVFEITNITKKTTDKFEAGKSYITVNWKTCKSLYGEGSKVRILLSDDFGQTFKYVLADEVPNNGTWTGIVPYVGINTVNVRDAYNIENPEYTFTYGTTFNNVRGGVIKIEVIGEAAYSLSKEIPYYVNGNTYVEGSGGFLIDDKQVQFTPKPPIYVEVDSEDLIPVKETLRVGNTVVQCEEKRENNIITREWKHNGATYKQLIKVNSQINIPFLVERKLRLFDKQLFDLHDNIGKLGYPKKELPLCAEFFEKYNEVYESKKKIKESVTMDKVDALEEVLLKFTGIADSDVVMPMAGKKYKIGSYHHTYGGDIYFLLNANPSNQIEEKLVHSNQTNVSIWNCKMVDSMYNFIDTMHNMSLSLRQSNKNKNGFRIVRGYSWGAFSMISGGEYPRIAQVSHTGTTISFNEHYYQDSIGYRVNKPEILISTDFIFIPVEESFPIYYQASSTTTVAPKVYLVSTNKNNPWQNGQSMTRADKGNNLFTVTIPEGFGESKLVFEVNGKKDTVQLVGKTETYSENAKRIHTLNLQSNAINSLCLDYPVVIPENVNVYTAVGAKNNNSEYALTLTRIINYIPANTPVLLKAEENKEYIFEETEKYVKEVAKNDLLGSITALENKDLSEDYNYYPLNKENIDNHSTIRFTKNTSNRSIEANKAYYRVYKYGDNTNVSDVIIPADEFNKADADITTQIDFKRKNKESRVYDLNGRVVGVDKQIQDLPKGVYIIEGKKVKQ